MKILNKTDYSSMSQLLATFLFFCLVCGLSCSSGEPSGDLGSVPGTGYNASCNPSANSGNGFNLLASVAYWPDVRQFIDTNCTSCHGTSRQERNLNFSDFNTMQSTLTATGRSLDKIVSQIDRNHKGSYQATDKTMFQTWKSDGYLELLPGKTVADYTNPDNNDTNTDTGNNDLNSTIQDQLSQFNQGDQSIGNASDTTGQQNANNTFSSANNLPCP